MAAFIGNYLQHIMDVIINDEYTYDDLSMAYSDVKEVSEESLYKSHTEKKRGNLPRGITPEVFYQIVIERFYRNPADLKEFSRKLCINLTEDGMFPSVWMDRKNLIDGFSDDFSADIFHTFIVYLLSQDKENRKAKRKSYGHGSEALASSESCEKRDIAQRSSLSFSSRFFTAGARSLTDASDRELDLALSQLSSVFCNISAIEFKNGDAVPSFDSTDMLLWMRDHIISCLEAPLGKEVLKIKGPLGAYKNRIMQYLYLSLERRAEKFIPVYIDIASYEKPEDDDSEIDEAEFLSAFEADIGTAEEIASGYPDRTPLLMLDGVRDFKFKNEALYYTMDERINRFGWSMIVCIDTDFTVNVQNRYNVHPLISNNYDCYWRIISMNLNRRQESLEFIKKCISVFGVDLPRGIKPKNIYDSLVKLDFLTIDAYWLTYILNTSMNEILDHNCNISDLYESICLGFLGSAGLVKKTAEFAFEFEYGNGNFDDANPLFDIRWKLIRKHRSVFDFLIAKYYIKKVSDLDLKNGEREHNIGKLSFFNMVLQKSITRFVVDMLTGIDNYERQIMIIAERYYDDLALFGKSELTFWMARLQNSMRKKQCVRLLREYKRKELARYEANDFASPEEKKKAAFLIRGICVSLIYENDSHALKYYLNSLLTDKTANTVNRGFHLEYYGDKPYIPSQSLLDFEDDITKGESAFTALCLSLDRRMHRRLTGAAMIEVMTLCNLIQARIEHNSSVAAMDVTPYVDKCIKYLEWVGGQPVAMNSRVAAYFRWFHLELIKFKDKNNCEPPIYNRADVMNTYSSASEVKRSGWADLKLPRPENIVEHMYSCWLIGMLYLPESYDDPDYSKRDILSMLLIHDLAEAQTGDVSRPVKNRNRAMYDGRENDIMRSLFFSGTYPGAENLSEYMELWDSWYLRQGINAVIAREIDNIQTIYRFCSYCLEHPELCSQDNVDYWLSGLCEVETDLGKNIASLLIEDNTAFEPVLKIFNKKQ